MPNEAFLKARYNEEKIMEKRGLNAPLKKLLYKTTQSTFEHSFSKNQIKMSINQKISIGFCLI